MMLGITSIVLKGPIFEQEQIARAAELGIGVSSFNDIEFLTDSPESEILVEKIKAEFVL